MFCGNCGKENTDGAKFCAYCGASLAEGQPEPKETEEKYEDLNGAEMKGAETSEPPAGKPEKKKKKTWVFVIAAVAVLAVAAAVAGILIFRHIQDKQHYEDSVASGNRYLEELDYEKAEASYLEAISVDPKQKEPYQKLIDTYVAQGKTTKAVETAEAAVEAVPEKETEEFQEIIKEWAHAEDYVWVTEPSVEADDITYISSYNYDNVSYNERQYQKQSDYAVIKQGDLYGLIGWDGKLAAEIEYEYITGFFGRYLLNLKEPGYEASLNVDWKSYFLDESTGELAPAMGMGGAFDLSGCYYYCGKLRNVNEAYDYMGNYGYTFTEPEGAIPVRKSDVEYTDADDYYTEWLTGPYAVYSDGKLVTDFIYEECGSQMSGILAAKKDGKWGYLDGEGNEVLPFEYDESWHSYDDYDSRSYCYSASEGYVPLVKDGVWEMRDANGDIVIPEGIFEEIRPVYHGKCWVKQDGKWGVIELGRSEAADEEKTEGDPAEPESTGGSEDGENTAAEEEKSSVKVTENKSPLTDEELAEISRELNVPEDLEVEITAGEQFYWEGGDAWLTGVSVLHDGETVAAANVNVDTKELATGILTYTP